MKKIASLAVVGSMVAWGLAAPLGGCGGDDSVPAADSDASADGSSGGSSGTTSSSSSGGSSTSSTSSSSSGGTTDGGADGAAPNPDKITCGATECATPTEACCASVSADAGQAYVCQPAGDPCSGAKIGCDEAPDCNGNDVCCTSVGGGSLSSECKATCGAQDVQLCKSASECGDGGACTEYTCPQGRKVRACDKPLACN